MKEEILLQAQESYRNHFAKASRSDRRSKIMNPWAIAKVSVAGGIQSSREIKRQNLKLRSKITILRSLPLLPVTVHTRTSSGFDQRPKIKNQHSRVQRSKINLLIVRSPPPPLATLLTTGLFLPDPSDPSPSEASTISSKSSEAPRSMRLQSSLPNFQIYDPIMLCCLAIFLPQFHFLFNFLLHSSSQYDLLRRFGLSSKIARS